LLDWDTADITDDFLLDAVSRFLSAALLKHCRLALPLIRSRQRDVAQFYRWRLLQQLWNSFCLVAAVAKPLLTRWNSCRLSINQSVSVCRCYCMLLDAV